MRNVPCFVQGERIIVKSVEPNGDQGIAFGDIQHERVSGQVAVCAVRIFGAVAETGKRLGRARAGPDHLEFLLWIRRAGRSLMQTDDERLARL